MSKFKLDTIERTLRTAAQSAAAAILVLWIDAGSFDQIEWGNVWKVAAFAAGLTVLTSLAGRGAGSSKDDGSVL